ncbi:MAG: hypothetical protein GX639_20585 [Fibrobacter sp.]|nr:hypothetical protein [Fibrobacter sp.]
MNRYLLLALFSLTTILPVATYAKVSLTAYSKEEALHERNISKPRIVIQNTGTRPVHGFSFFYYITTEKGSRPIVDNYYVPNARVSLEKHGPGKYAVRYDVSGVTLHPGESYPDDNGCVVGIHYPRWEPLSKRNDRSCNLSDELVYNPEISVYTNEPSHPNHGRHAPHSTHSTRATIDIEIRR